MDTTQRDRLEKVKAELDDLLSAKLVEVGGAVRAARQLTDSLDSHADGREATNAAELLARLEALADSLR